MLYVPLGRLVAVIWSINALIIFIYYLVILFTGPMIIVYICLLNADDIIAYDILSGHEQVGILSMNM